MSIWRRVTSPRASETLPATPEAVFDEALGWFLAHDAERRYFVERDLAWTIQAWLLQRVAELHLSWQVHNDFEILHGARRAVTADLAVLVDGEPALAIELSYEPSHRRTDLGRDLPVIAWPQVERDAERIRRFVGSGHVAAALAVLVDEGGFFRSHPVVSHGHWLDVGSLKGDPALDVSVHVVRAIAP